MITQNELKQYVHYDPETGIFTNIKYRGGLPVGKILDTHEGAGYINFKIKGKTYKAHRMAFLYMTGQIPEYVDHINTVRDDNRWCNLREATWNQNQHNSSLRSDNKSGVKGVAWHNRDNIWYARVRADGKEKYLGYFEDLEEARLIVENYRNKVHKEYARQENHL